MILKIYLYTILTLSGCKKEIPPTENQTPLKRTAYYFSAKGDDKNDGSRMHPLKTISVLNTLNLNEGDSVLLKGRETFTGKIQS